MKKTDLLNVISSPTLAKLSKGANIQTDNIDKICLFLKCQPDDIMEVLYDETPPHQVFGKTYLNTCKYVISEYEEPNEIVTEEIIDTRQIDNI